VNVLEPVPLEVFEDMVTLLAAKVKSGVAASARGAENTEANAARTSKTTTRRYLCMAETSLRMECNVPTS
jgi:hypothetical protein